MNAPLRILSLISVVLIAACSTDGAAPQKCGPDTEPCTAPPYADTEWTTIHATSRNNDYVQTTVATNYEEKWKVLEGSSTLMGPSIGPEGNLYITTPSSPGTSTLHAYDSDGNTLWESEPWEDSTGLDSCAGYQTPIVDTEGDVYVSDCNQLWSFSSNGTLRWAVDLPAPPEGAAWQTIDAAPVNSFVTGFFSKEGAVGGITIWGDIVLVSRNTGEPVAQPAKMPGSVAVSDDELPTSEPGDAPPPGVWRDDLMDPDMISPVWYVFDGVTPGANTPAVHPETGRIFNTGFSEPDGDDLGALYGFDFVPGSDGALGTIEVAINFVMGPGSGSSPGISPDGSIVYVSDGQGKLYAVDERSGDKNWELQTGTAPASPSVGPDGAVYLLGGKAGSAINPDGTTRWVADLDELAATLIPPNDDPESMLSGPSTFNNAIPTVTETGILTSVAVGYYLSLPSLGRELLLPVRQIVVVLDPETGKPYPGFGFIEADDTIEGFVIPSLESTVYVNNGALLSTAASFTFGNTDLPGDAVMMEYSGGLQAFTPSN